jgi:hypothetical protein
MDNQRSLQSTPLFTAWFNHQYMLVITVITTSVVQDLNEKIAGVDRML